MLLRCSAALAALCLLAGPSAAAPLPGAPLLSFPLACVIGRSCEIQHYVDRDPGPGVRDYHGGRRTYDGHKGVDLRIPDMAAERAGVNVLAAAPGRVVGMRDGVADIAVNAPGAPSVKDRECGNGVVIDHGGGWVTQYCHLQRGSVRVRQGDQVVTGQPIGRVGLSGFTEFAHMHFEVRHAGVVVDPFAPGAGSPPLWSPAALRQLTYKSGVVLNAGFATTAVSMEAIEAGSIAAPAGDPPAVVAYVRAIELQGGDEVALALKGPDGEVLAQDRKPLDRDKAQYMAFVGKKRPPTGWPRGTYQADCIVYRDGKPVIRKTFSVTL